MSRLLVRQLVGLLVLACMHATSARATTYYGLGWVSPALSYDNSFLPGYTVAHISFTDPNTSATVTYVTGFGLQEFDLYAGTSPTDPSPTLVGAVQTICDNPFADMRRYGDDISMLNYAGLPLSQSTFGNTSKAAVIDGMLDWAAANYSANNDVSAALQLATWEVLVGKSNVTVYSDVDPVGNLTDVLALADTLYAACYTNNSCTASHPDPQAYEIAFGQGQDVVDPWGFPSLTSDEPLPEPGTILVLLSGITGIVTLRRRSRRSA
jgi:hypothetical protein